MFLVLSITTGVSKTNKTQNNSCIAETPFIRDWAEVLNSMYVVLVETTTRKPRAGAVDVQIMKDVTIEFPVRCLLARFPGLNSSSEVGFELVSGFDH